MKSKSLFNRVYFNEEPLKYSDYEKSRNIFLFEGCAASGIFSLSTGAFLAGFASYLGIDNQLNGIIASLPVFTCVIQVFSPIVFEKIQRRKLLVSILCFIFRALLGIMFFIPLFTKSPTVRIVMLIATYGAAYSLSAFVSPPASNWIVDLTPENIRGRYLAQKDAYSLAFVTVLTIVMGRVLDIFDKNNSQYTGFLIVGIITIILTFVNFYFISSVKEPPVRGNIEHINLKRSLMEPIKNISFRKVILLSVIWNIALQIAAPFFSIYMVTGLKLSYTYIMAMGVIASLVRVITVKYWGRLADSKSWFFATELSVGVLGVCHLMWSLVNGNTATVLVPIVNIIGGLAWAGINISMFNIQFVFAPKEGRTMYLGLNAAVGGVVGFLSTLVGSYIINRFQYTSFNIFNFAICNMQIIFATSGILLVLCTLFIHFFINNFSK